MFSHQVTKSTMKSYKPKLKLFSVYLEKDYDVMEREWALNNYI